MDNRDDTAGPATELAEILNALAQSPCARVVPIDVTGNRVWVKRYDTESMPPAKRLHGFLSPILYPAFLRGSIPAHGSAGVRRECAKIAAFNAAGFMTPKIIHQSGAMLILSDTSPVLSLEIATMQPPARQAMLAVVFATLGRLHAAGLAHGRPHLRDISVQNGTVCFFDFEEAPETRMPIQDAQARDLWLLMLPVVAVEADCKTLSSCLDIWMAHAPAATIRSLIRLVRYCRPVLFAAKFIPAALHGGDLRRLLAATKFLAASISDMDSALAHK